MKHREIQTLAWAYIFALLGSALAQAQDPLFEFTGKDPNDPKNWQKPLNWNLNGEPAARIPGSGPDDRVIIPGSEVSNVSGVIKSLTFGGSITGGSIVVKESLLIAGGAFRACAVTILDHATVTTSASGLNAFDSCLVENRGVFAPQSIGLGAVAGQPATVFKNDPLTGVIELRDGSFIGSTADGSIESSGSIVKIAGPGTATVAGVQLFQKAAGHVTCLGGTLRLGFPNPTSGRFVCDQPIVTQAPDAIIEIAGTTSELQLGCRISGPGTALLNRVIVSDAIETENVRIPSHGVVEGSGDIAVIGRMEIDGGSLLGRVGETGPTARLLIRSSGTLRFLPNGNGASVSRNIENSGSVLQEMGTGPGHPFGASGTPTFDNLPGATVTLSAAGGLGSRLLNNQGTVRKIINSDLNSTEIFSRGCMNSGLFEVQTGLVRFVGLTQTAGELHVAANAEVRIQGTGADFQGGVITGAGLLRSVSSTSPIRCSAVVRPGADLGGLSLTGGEGSLAFTPSTRIEIELGAPADASGFDQSILNNAPSAMNLAGKISLKRFDGFAPVVGQAFSIVRYAPGRTGTFDEISGLASIPGILLLPRYTAASLDLVATIDPKFRMESASADSAIVTMETSERANYLVESSNELTSGLWTPIGPLIHGDGQSHQVALTYPPGPQRFFRLRVE